MASGINPARSIEEKSLLAFITVARLFSSTSTSTIEKFVPYRVPNIAVYVFAVPDKQITQS